MQVRIKDGSFFQANSATLAGDNTGLGPKYFSWCRDDAPAPVTFFTDICLEAAPSDPSPKKIAWLIEPPEVNSKSYKFCADNEDVFDYILTHSCQHIINDKWLFYPFGGSWIAEEKWQVWLKSKQCSIIASSKKLTEGHRFRHKVIKKYDGFFDALGSGYTPIDRKFQGLLPYRYSIVIENARRDWWFTEKLIDCFSVGTIPIYWGCPDIGKFFNSRGIIGFSGIDSLGNILRRISEDDYRAKLPAINDNLKRAYKYRCAEDWIFEQYPFLFK